MWQSGPRLRGACPESQGCRATRGVCRALSIYCQVKGGNVKTTTQMAIVALVLASVALPAQADHVRRTYEVVLQSSEGTTFTDCFRFDQPQSTVLTIDGLGSILYTHGGLGNRLNRFKGVGAAGNIAISFFGSFKRKFRRISGEAVNNSTASRSSFPVGEERGALGLPSIRRAALRAPRISKPNKTPTLPRSPRAARPRQSRHGTECLARLLKSTGGAPVRARRDRRTRSPAPGSAAGVRLGRMPFRGIRRERELGHQQEPAADVLEAPVHLALDIRKDPIAEQAFQQAFGEQGGTLAAGMPPEPAGKMPALRSAAFQAAG